MPESKMLRGKRDKLNLERNGIIEKAKLRAENNKA